MKTRRVLRVGSAMGLLLAVGLVAGCPDDESTGQPAVQQQQPPATPAPGTQVTPGGTTTPPATQDRPTQVPPAEDEAPMEEEGEEDMDQEEQPAQPQR